MMYSGTRLLEILLNNNDHTKICKERPMHIDKSSTFVIDLDSLRHPDDVKKDEFGRWQYSGSHTQSYLAWKSTGDKFTFQKVTDASKVKENSCIFHLRRIHCKHPSNSQLQRLLAFVTGENWIVLYS